MSSINPKDPLNKADNNQRELFTRMAKAATGFPYEHVLGASANILINSVRQAHGSRKNALDAFDEVVAKSRAVLAAHYDGAGNRRNIFPYTQNISMPLFDARPKDITKPN